TQFTYFQQVGGIELDVISLELTYGLERIAMFIQEKESVYDLEWVEGYTYGDVHKIDEIQFSRYNFEAADTSMLLKQFDMYEQECKKLLKDGIVIPAYDYVLKCSHAFNLLDARKSIGVAQRTRYIGRVRGLAKGCAEGYLKLISIPEQGVEAAGA
ncbi:MAG: glycine--tRNA ligase subunit alpha, partial [Candidatus Brocadiales bacterium]|nr:glycine--tRNA ligase subunit alpha [Candidatus Brocadiales bacterium]